MINKFDELAKGLARSVTRRQALRRFGAGLAGMALACFGLATAVQAQTSVITDPIGDAVFPFDFYSPPVVPPYLDMVQISVSLNNGVFHFEVQMAAKVPSTPAPGLTPSANHLGVGIGIQTDRQAATTYTFFGQNNPYHFNFVVGALYSFADSGAGLPLGWSGFLIGNGTVVAVPMQIRGDTLVFETSAVSLGNPSSFQWAAATECDPVPLPEEHQRSVILVDYVPDRDYASWPAQ